MRRDDLPAFVASALSTFALVGLLASLAIAASPPAQSTESALRASVACWAPTLGVTPRWNLTVEVVRDSDEWRNNYGSALVSGDQLEARIIFNLFAIERDTYPTRIAALHEVLHVATGELASRAFAYDRETGVIEAERLVRQMVRWPNWRGVCEKP